MHTLEEKIRELLKETDSLIEWAEEWKNTEPYDPAGECKLCVGMNRLEEKKKDIVENGDISQLDVMEIFVISLGFNILNNYAMFAMSKMAERGGEKDRPCPLNTPMELREKWASEPITAPAPDINLN